MKKLIVIMFVSFFSTACTGMPPLPTESFAVGGHDNYNHNHDDHHPGVIGGRYDHHHHWHHGQGVEAHLEGDSAFMRGLRERIRQKRVTRNLQHTIRMNQIEGRMYQCGLTGDC